MNFLKILPKIFKILNAQALNSVSLSRINYIVEKCSPHTNEIGWHVSCSRV